MTEKQGAAPTMSALARTVGISRQALYLHFPDRAQLLLALVADIDEKDQLQAGRAAVREAADAAGAIRAWARMQACRNPKIAAAARALNATPPADPAAAWGHRTRNPMRGAISIIGALRSQGRLRPTWPVTEAAGPLWEPTSFRV